MQVLKLLTAGESHNKALVAILEGLPYNSPVDIDFINRELARRQMGYGRGGRMKIETDRVNILSGIMHGKVLGSPIAFMIENKDYENWKNKAVKPQTVPRPGHADLAGCIKYGTTNARDILERASARETAIRVAAGAMCKVFLKALNINIFSYVHTLGNQRVNRFSISIEQKREASQANDLNCPPNVYETFKQEVDLAREGLYTIGGEIEIIAENVPVGLGSSVHYDRKIDAQIAMMLMSIPAVKAIEFGHGFQLSQMKGYEAMDEIYYDNGYKHKTNKMGGIEGGMTNGENIIVNIAMKPIPTQMKPLSSIDLMDNTEKTTFKERSDTNAVPACGVIAENLLAIVLVDAILDKFGRDNFDRLKKEIDEWRLYSKDIVNHYENYY